jgi:phosphoribosylformylglycinamidine synthase
VSSHRFVVSVMPKPGILDPQGRAIEQSMPHLEVSGVSDVRVGRRVELTVEATDMLAARAIVERLAGEVFANPIIETWEVAPASLVAVAG